MATERRKSVVSASAPPPILKRGPKGDPGDPGPPGPPGESIWIASRESRSSDLFGRHPQGFAQVDAAGGFIECSFGHWAVGDLLIVEFWCQVLCARRSGSIIVQAQISTDNALNWHGLSGGSAYLSPESYSASASVSIELPTEPLVRLFVMQMESQGPEYGPGPEGSSLVLRCTQLRGDAFAPTGRLVPPRH